MRVYGRARLSGALDGRELVAADIKNSINWGWFRHGYNQLFKKVRMDEEIY